MIERYASDIWDVIKAYDIPYDWTIGQKARTALDNILGEPANCWNLGNCAQENRSLRDLLSRVLNDPHTDDTKAARLYGWIVADWGGVHKNRHVVEAWASPDNGWHGSYRDEVLLKFADQVQRKRISSWSKVFAFAAPDRHAIFDSRVAVALNLALEELGHEERFFMPPSRVVKDKNGVNRPNAVARARERLNGKTQLGYQDYLRWLRAVRDRPEGPDFLTIESSLFVNAPVMAAKLEQRRLTQFGASLIQQ